MRNTYIGLFATALAALIVYIFSEKFPGDKLSERLSLFRTLYFKAVD